jgi:hypothetical protein
MAHPHIWQRFESEEDIDLAVKLAVAVLVKFTSVSNYFLNLVGINVINAEEVAIKLEPIRAKHPQLEYEARVYKALAGGGKHFPP